MATLSSLLAVGPTMTLALVVAFAAVPSAAAELAVDVHEVLDLGPFALPRPAFHDAAQEGMTLADLMSARALDVTGLQPRAGGRVALAGGRAATWGVAAAPVLWEALPAAPAEAWLAFYLRSDRWQSATLVLAAPAGSHLQAWHNGAPLALKSGSERTADAPAAADAADAAAPSDRHEAELKLPIGVSLVVVRSVVADDFAGAWRLAPSVELDPAAAAASVTATTDSRRPADIGLILDAPRVQSAQISPDGSLAAVRLAAYEPDGRRDQWLEVRRVPAGELVTTWRGQEIGGLQWTPDGRRLSFTQRSEKTSDLWLLDLERGGATRLLRGIEDMQNYQWAPDGTFVIYAVQVDAKPDERKVKRVSNPADRQPRWRHRQYLVLAGVPDGLSRRLTAGPLSPERWSISPDSRRLLFFHSDQDLGAGRPFLTSELWEMDLATLQVEQLVNDPWITAAAYGPDPELLLLQGSPSAFGGLGRNLPDGVQANDYGGQLYLFDRRTGGARPLTRDFDPDVADSWWSLDDGLVYAVCTDTQFRNVYRCDPRRANWERVDTGLEYTDQFDLARRGRRAVAHGTGAATPPRVTAVDLRRNRSQQLHDPGSEVWRDVAFGEVQYWQAPLPDGELLDGRIYWPVDYDPARTYPVIVYYYGGTTPVGVDFGGRYPKNVWTGQGYIVYVPQPSGAIGYGQAFAARHVNDWGKRTAWEVIAATQAFLAAFPAADPERVGCIGASYGGFLTMYLLTQTDLFAAAVSHAGISSLASYWGEGLWGYVYGARALADAFPWSDRDLYVEQSALFHADKISTPLLLVHGDSDTNVPVGESDQLFVALKLLGREVEYVQIQGQDHHIIDRDQRIVWNDTILAFFAKWLKEQPQWWEDLYRSP